MIYGYVNRHRGETEDFLDGYGFDKIIFHDKPSFDFSFAEKGDTVIMREMKSVAANLKEMLEFCQFIFETGIEICCKESESDFGYFVNTKTAIGKMIVDILSGLNKFDDSYFQENRILKEYGEG